MLRKSAKLLSILRSRPYRLALLRHNVAAGVEHERVLKGLDFRSVVDVGANRGQFSLVARRCLPAATIVAFEPLPGPAERFRHVFAGDPRVRLHEIALGQQGALSCMHVSGKDDASSLLPITPLMSSLFPGTAQAGTIMVRVGRLADYVSAGELASPALLKLDVQGYELEALRGCEELLDSFSHVYAECSFVELYRGQVLADDLIVWLRGHTFRLSGVYGVVYDRWGRAVEADLLFRKAVVGTGA
jgi:FkbM family methyltransferase